MAPGYLGKILKINLNDLTYTVEEKDDYFYRTFMGGSAMASYFLLTEMEKGVDPLGPDNVLVLTTSILTGAALPGANRFTMAAKSPLSDGFGEAEAGGFFSVQLKKAGFDAVVIKVRRDEAVRSTSGLIVCGINRKGIREVLGLRLGDSETEETWRELFEWLKGRGQPPAPHPLEVELVKIQKVLDALEDCQQVSKKLCNCMSTAVSAIRDNYREDPH